MRPWLGWFLIGVGALLMLLGWFGVSREALPAKQIPYLVSGGIGGMFLGILGGPVEQWAQYGHAYRQAWTRAGHPADQADVAVAVHGFVADDDRHAKATYLDHELNMFATGAAEIGRPPMQPAGRDASYQAGQMVFVGGPNEIADRILHLHDQLGHSRQILQMDVGGMPHKTFLRSIELLGTEVLPQIHKELNPK